MVVVPDSDGTPALWVVSVRVNAESGAHLYGRPMIEVSPADVERAAVAAGSAPPTFIDGDLYFDTFVLTPAPGWSGIGAVAIGGIVQEADYQWRTITTPWIVEWIVTCATRHARALQD
jgi:hypothetical protein